MMTNIRSYQGSVRTPTRIATAARTSYTGQYYRSPWSGFAKGTKNPFWELYEVSTPVCPFQISNK